MSKPVVVSGIRATGRLHLGNYIGAMRNFAPLQDEYDCFIFVADLHTLTSLKDPEQLRSNLPEIVADYLATGLDPTKCTIFAQSSVPQIPELALLLGMIVSLPELERCPTFKDKVRNQPEDVNLGLLSYPVLMAADILAHRAQVVPVGEDQLPHIELTRTIAKRFNHRYGEVFPLPDAMLEQAVRVPGLDGSNKMGKSEGNTIDLMDSPAVVSTKVSRAVTDTRRQRRTDPGHPYECNIYTLHEFVNNESAVAEICQGCQSATLGCVECKQQLASAVTAYLAPFQERRVALSHQIDVGDVLREGGLRARASAQQTVEQVRTLMGVERY